MKALVIPIILGSRDLTEMTTQPGLCLGLCGSNPYCSYHRASPSWDTKAYVPIGSHDFISTQRMLGTPAL